MRRTTNFQDRSCEKREATAARSTDRTLRILLWNLEWATPRSPRGRRIRAILAKLAPDVVCLTESTAAMLPNDGFALDARPGFGYGATGERRKVILWSRNPWCAIDRVGDEALPGGRYVCGVTQGTRFVGVCVPWRDAHVRTGRRDREPWEDHHRYLDALRGVVRRQLAAPEPLVVFGDLNQRLPRYRQPPDVRASLQRVMSEGLACPTADDAGWVRGQIDHLLVGAGVDVFDLVALPRVGSDGLRLSDHGGLVVRLNTAP